MSESEITAGKNHVGSIGYVWLYNRENGDFNGLPILLGRLAVGINRRDIPVVQRGNWHTDQR